MFSPCTICDNDGTYNWELFCDTLDFINEYLDCEMDTIEGSAFHEDLWYIPPTCTIAFFDLFSSAIAGNLQKLISRGNSYSCSSDGFCNEYNIQNKDYFISNKQELDFLMYYTANINSDYLLFLGNSNHDINSDYLDVLFQYKNIHIPVIKDPWLDETGHFDDCIIPQEPNEIFVNRKLCEKLDEKMHSEENSINGPRGSFYKKYGKIVAHRNNFIPYKPKNPYDQSTDYYIRRDGKNIISVDMLHGHFEVFNPNGKRLWRWQYNFSGEQIELKGKTLKEMQDSHRVDK